MHKNSRYSYFYNVKSDSVLLLFEKQSQNEHLSQISDKRDEKVVHEKTYLMELEFYNTDGKIKNIIRCIFISIIMHTNFMLFRQKISFKSALECFASVSAYFRRAFHKTCEKKLKNN